MNVVYENKSKPIELMQSSSLSSLPHLHKEVEIIFAKEGSARCHADREYFDIKTGEIFVSFPNQVHFYEKVKKGKYYVFIISPKVFFGIKDVIYSNVPVRNAFLPDREFCDYVTALVHSKVSGDISACTGYSNLMMSKILSVVELKPTVKSADGTLREVMEFCKKHFTEDINLSLVAQNTHLSKCYISHLFSSKLSIGFSDYINILRINAACELLMETDKKISDISEDVGFGTIRSFNRAFLKIMDKTPQCYRDSLAL